MTENEAVFQRESERIVPLYEQNAAAWDRMRGRDLHEKPWLDRFLALVPAGGTILDRSPARPSCSPAGRPGDPDRGPASVWLSRAGAGEDP